MEMSGRDLACPTECWKLKQPDKSTFMLQSIMTDRTVNEIVKEYMHPKG